jgi:hypothetical protein
MADGVYAILAGMLLGGKGMQACEGIREDPLLAEIFGMQNTTPSSPTVYRILCKLSGLSERKMGECYEPNGTHHASLDMFGGERAAAALRRVVPASPEEVEESCLQLLEAFFESMAKKCAKTLKRNLSMMYDWHVVFGDATDLEVEGNCFDAARLGRDGKKILRWQTLMLGALLIAQRLGAGNEDEGRGMPPLLEKGFSFIREVLGPRARILGLLDAAYFEKQVLDNFDGDFIVCANQQRNSLKNLAEERFEREWQSTGADAGRGWIESGVCCFTHLPGNWNKPVTIVARRYRKTDDLPGVWHYSFLATRIEPGRMPKDLMAKHGSCQAIWMLYGTKQARENHYKTPLRDFNLHHPPSGRLGLSQAYYFLAASAANIAMVMRYGVVDASERGIEFWRLRERYFAIAGRLVRCAGRKLKVLLAGANIASLRQALWRKAYAAAAAL